MALKRGEWRFLDRRRGKEPGQWECSAKAWRGQKEAGPRNCEGPPLPHAKCKVIQTGVGLWWGAGVEAPQGTDDGEESRSPWTQIFCLDLPLPRDLEAGPCPLVLRRVTCSGGEVP